MTHKTCGNACAEQYGREKARQLAEKQKRKEAKEERLSIRERKDRLKNRTKWLSEAQDIFNAFIRKRDEELPCISCGRMNVIQWHAGHYKTRKAHPELRFDEANVHKQCSQCNDHDSGNISAYKPNLIKKIGIEEVERLDNSSELHKYTIDEIKSIKATYKAKLKELQHG